MKKQLIKYKAVKIKNRPVNIEFCTKQGEKLFIKGTEAYEVFDPLELKTPDLLKWLRKNGLPNLAKALKKATEMSESLIKK